MKAIINSTKTKMAQQVSCINNPVFSIVGVIVGGDTGCVGSALAKNINTGRYYSAVAGVLASLPSDIIVTEK
jgi:hypothetical protein